MLSRGLLCAVLLALAGSVTAQLDTIVDVVVGSSNHTTLRDLVTRAELIDTLKGAGKFTLFAPTNDAFCALGTTSTLVLKIAANPLLQDVMTQLPSLCRKCRRNVHFAATCVFVLTDHPARFAGLEVPRSRWPNQRLWSPRHPNPSCHSK